MQYFYKLIKDGKIVQVGSQSFPATETTEIKPITKEEHDSLVAEWKEHAAKVREYVEQIQKGEITLDEVPEDCKTEVERDVKQVEIDQYAKKVKDGDVVLTDVPEEYRTAVEERLAADPELVAINRILQEVSEIDY